MKRLSHLLNFEDVHIEGYATLLYLMGLFYPWVWGLLALYLYKVKHMMSWVLWLGYILVMSLMYVLMIQIEVPTTIHSEVTVLHVKETRYDDEVTIQYGLQKFHIKAQKNLYHPGDVLFVQGRVMSYRAQTVPYGFNEKTFHLSSGVYGQIETIQVHVSKHKFSIFELRTNMIESTDQLQSKSYLRSLIFAEKSFEENDQALFRNLGITYLLTASGLHVYALMSLVKKGCFYVSLEEVHVNRFILLIYGCLFYLSYGALGIFRLLIMHVMHMINVRTGEKMTQLDMIQIAFALMLIIDIHLIYHQGFLITYLIVNVIYLMEFRYRGLSFYVKRLYMTGVIQLVMLPFTAKISLFVILCMPLIVFFFSTVLYLGALIVFIMPFTDPFYVRLTLRFTHLLTFLESMQSTLFLPQLDLWQVFIYMILLISLLMSKNIFSVIKRGFILALLFIGVMTWRGQQSEIIFMDVGQGDGIFIRHEGCKILIDNFKNVSSYLKNLGIYELDFLILTHSDNDHIKETHQILETIKVKKLILSAYDQGYPYYHTTVERVKSEDRLTCKSLHLEILGPLRAYTSKNNASIVIQMRLLNQVYLFTGDIEKEAEADLSARYQDRLKSDVLKVAHHGSVTSSSLIFLSYVRPTTVIISSGHRNRFGFPHDQALLNLQKYAVNIYRTDLHGSIQILPSTKKEKWKFNLPFFKAF